jgi:hypothetical protein
MQQVKGPGDTIVNYEFDLPITVAAQSKAWTVFAHSNAGIVG